MARPRRVPPDARDAGASRSASEPTPPDAITSRSVASSLEATDLDVIASGGVGSLADLEAPASLASGGTRLGRAIARRARYGGAGPAEAARAPCAQYEWAPVSAS